MLKKESPIHNLNPLKTPKPQSLYPIISNKKEQPESYNFLTRFIETMSKVTGVSIILKNQLYLPKEEDFKLDNSYFIHNSKFCSFIKSYPNELRKCWDYEQNKIDKKLHSTKKMFVTKCRFGVADGIYLSLMKRIFLVQL